MKKLIENMADIMDFIVMSRESERFHKLLFDVPAILLFGEIIFKKLFL